MQLTTKIIGVSLAAAALCGLGAAAATAATPGHPSGRLGDAATFRVDVANTTTSPIRFTGYTGSDWSTAYANPAVGTVLAPGQETGVFLYFAGGATDTVNLTATDGSGTIGIQIAQGHTGGSTESKTAGSTLYMDVRDSGDGYAIVSVDDPKVYTEQTILTYQADLSGLQSVSIPAFTCPADHPWLVDQALAPGRIVPNGVEIDEPHSIGFTMGDPSGDSSNRATGWSSNDGSATNWDVHSHVLQVFAHCTDDPSQSYPA